MRSGKEWKEFKAANPEHVDTLFVTRPVDQGMLARAREIDVKLKATGYEAPDGLTRTEEKERATPED